MPDVVLASADYTTQVKYSDGSVPGGNTIASTSAETAFASVDSNSLLAYQLCVGDVIRITCRGVFSTAGTAPTLRFRIQLGASTIIFSTGSPTVTGSMSNAGWALQVEFIVTAIGASGSIEVQGNAICVSNPTTGAVQIFMPGNTSAVTLDTTVDNAITILAKWGTSSSSNTITMRQMFVEVLRA